MTSVDALLLGGRGNYEVTVPHDVLAPAAGGGSDAADRGAQGPQGAPVVVRLRPLVLADVQRLQRAARDDRALTSVLMVQQSMVEPAVTIEQVNAMHCGLVEFLVGHVNRISGLTMGRDELDEAVRAPLARACFELSRQFGWTPDQCAALTVGQILVYLEMLGSTAETADPLVPSLLEETH
jgi:hypothetical protein